LPANEYLVVGVADYYRAKLSVCVLPKNETVT